MPLDIEEHVGITRINGRYLVCSSDPITGADERMGWHAVNVSANDVATSGIMPDTLSFVGLFPEGAKSSEIEKTILEIIESAKKLGITVLGGHVEINRGVNKPLIMATAFGSGNKFVTSADAKSDDAILMTKTAGIEGTSILAKLRDVTELVGEDVANRGKELIDKLSILAEARVAFETRKVHAMHDSTEGGIIGSVLEMSLASGNGFELYTDSIPIDSTTKKICSKLDIDPLKLIGSGALLIGCRRNSENLVIDALRTRGIDCSKIGFFCPLKKGKWIVSGGEKTRKIKESSVIDELWPTLERFGAVD